VRRSLRQQAVRFIVPITVVLFIVLMAISRLGQSPDTAWCNEPAQQARFQSSEACDAYVRSGDDQESNAGR
jgi:hypothetical protein